MTLRVPVLASLFLIACSSTAPRPGAPADAAPTAADPAPAAAPMEPGHFDSALAGSGELPFPEAADTLSWDLPTAGADSAASPARADTAKSAVRPKPPALPPVSRPEGIRSRPRPKDLPDRVHVLLSRGHKPLSIYSLGDMQIFAEVAEGKSASLSKLAQLKGRFVIRRSGGAFLLDQAGKTLQTTTARKLRLISVNPFNLIDMGTGVYRGGMHVIGDAEGQILAVNVLGIEDYLRGVLPYELGNIDREGLEALKAQAIVARTYAFKRMLRGANHDFHLYSDVQDQVYKGVRGEYLMSDRAVWETRGMAVIHADTMAVCYYFSTCAGRTASKHEVWGGDSIPYLVTQHDTDAMGDPFCQASKYMSWNQEWSQQQLTGILRRNLKSAGVPDFPGFSGIEGMSVTQRASCGRARILTITSDRGTISVRGDKTRWALRPPANEEKIMPSAWFTVKAGGGKFAAQGKGFGHGVGLCQMGSIARARANQTFVQIIRAYYKGVDVAEFR